MTKKKQSQILQKKINPSNSDQKLPLRVHLNELRSRFFKCVLAVALLSVGGYFIQEQLVRILLKPAKGQQFIYTSPVGGINFLFQVCLYFGIVLSIPVIVFHLLSFIEPLLRQGTRRIIGIYSFISVILAAIGLSFGYFIGLPVTLGFLSRQFTTTQIKPLLTIQEYMSFVTIYLLGTVLLFQLPLIIMFINRIRPLSPRSLFGFQRYMILGAFIAAAIMTPTTDIFNQMLFAGPIILMYELAVVILYFKNRQPKAKYAADISEALPKSIISIPVSELESTTTIDVRRQRRVYWDIMRPAAT
jgi:sec-independent protein translocase protein TatC